MRAGIELHLPVKIHKQGKWYVSSCPWLDVHSQGRTQAEAHQNLADALRFFVESCVRRKTLEEVLRASGLPLNAD